MRSSRGGENRCRRAREYYYDLLYGDHNAVPEAIVRHVERCSTCQQQIECLRAAFSHVEEQAGPSLPQRDQAVLDTLSRQFELLGESVTCSQARPFLSDLLIPSQKIRIPTPVTVHVEHCPQCTEDLALLREQGLTADQLKRLSLFYVLAADSGPESNASHATSQAPAREDGIPCHRARPAVAALAAFSFEGVDPTVLRHVITCPQCRTRVYRRRARIMDRLLAGAGRQGGLACMDILPSDLFDGIVPLDEPVAVDGARERGAAVFAHVRTCRQCMEKAQSLHRAVFAVSERTDSGIDTVYQSEPATRTSDEVSESTSCRYPIRVRIVQHEPASGGRLAGAPRRRLAGTAWRYSGGLVSAAVVVIAIALFQMNTSTATATVASEIRQAISRAANVRVVQFHGAQTQFSLEMWIARDRDVLAARDSLGRTECIDLNEARRTIVYPDGRPCERIRLSKGECRAGSEMMTLANLLADLPADADLRPVEDGVADAAVAAVTMYERTWDVPIAASVSIPHRLTVAVDPATQLPGRMVLSRRNRQGEWESVTTTEFEYLRSADMDKVLTGLLAAQ